MRFSACHFNRVLPCSWYPLCLCHRFAISLREIACESDAQAAVSQGVGSVQQQGFINYFGFQRVGLPSNEIRPYHIGQQILAGNWKDAVTLILTPSEREPESVARAKKVYLETADVDAALEQMPQRMNLERSVLQVIATSVLAHACHPYRDLLTDGFLLNCRGLNATATMHSTVQSGTCPFRDDSCTCTRTRVTCSTRWRPLVCAVMASNWWKVIWCGTLRPVPWLPFQASKRSSSMKRTKTRSRCLCCHLLVRTRCTLPTISARSTWR